MNRREFIKKNIFLMSSTFVLKDFNSLISTLSFDSKKIPVIFTSHGNPMDIIKTKEEKPFWKKLNELGKLLKTNYEIKAVLVVSAHWCTKGTYVNISERPKQIFDYYGFPEEYYKVFYSAPGHPEIAKETAQLSKFIQPTLDWGLDHGAWPMLMHLFPEGDIPVFQLSINYYAKSNYHYQLAQELKSLRNKGVLIIGSGALIHNLQLAMQKLSQNDYTPYGWEVEYDEWIKHQIEQRNIQNLLNYESSHKLGKLAAPTPDHFVPLLYAFGLIDNQDTIQFFYEQSTSLPAFSERSFIAF